jgi:thiol-disulfide isomerase/thioredoxin|tara:strand:- start:791 stop:1036 length:246 start_codon:yes stop_codon:yes gene_type:complete
MKTAKYFGATWCGPCKTFKPVMNEVAGEGHSVQFIDIDRQQDLAAKYNVRSVPTVIIEEGGVEVDRVVGMQTKLVMLERLS